MEDKIDELTRILGNNKKSVIKAFIIYIIITLVILVWIWIPKTDGRIKYNKVNMDSKKKELANYYYNDILSKFKSLNKETVSSLLSDDYLYFLDKKNEDVINELEGKGVFSSDTIISNMTIYEDKGTYVYTATINNTIKINLIEEEPYSYVIAFDDFYSYNDNEESVTKANIKFTIDSEYRNFEYIKYKMRIDNKENVYCSFKFSDIKGVQAVLEDGTKFDLANSVATEEYTVLNTNTTISKQFVFNIPVQLQNSIEYIIFNDVKIDSATMNIKINV